MHPLPLAGPAASRDMEISALAWHGDDLILVPERLGLADDEDGVVLAGPQRVFVLDRREILSRLDGRGPTPLRPLRPRAIPVVPDITALLPDCDGFEALTFVGDEAYLTVETRADPHAPHPETNPAVLVRGHLAADLSRLTLDLAGQRRFARPTRDHNTSYEALLAWHEALFAIYELNGTDRVPRPHAAVFSLDLVPRGLARFPHLAYRVTDVTTADAAGRLWAINFRYPGSPRAGPPPSREALRARFGAGPSHRRYQQVERLVELRMSDGAIRLSDRAPIQLALPGSWRDGAARNWEGIVRLPGRGFLLVTDKYPTTQLAFVPFVE